MNERTVLECIRRLGPISRAQISRKAGLSKPTVSLALTALDAARLVREAGRTSGGKGPTAVLYEINPAAGWVVGIDVGREHVRAAMADLNGTVVARRDEAAETRSAATLIGEIGRLARATVEDAGRRWRDVNVVAVGSPGVFERDGDHPALAYNLPGWNRQGLLDAVRDELRTAVVFENDVNLAALGEREHGIGKDVADFVYLHLGTGVGMGVVIGGELYRGASGAAGEIGYLPLADADPHDRANRRRGALESAIGAAGIVKDARREGMGGALTAAKVFEAARAGDPRAVATVERLGQRIALAIAAIVPVLDPALVIVGGGVGRNLDVLRRPIERELLTVSPFTPRIEGSILQEDAELTGAVVFALGAAREHLFDRGHGRKKVAV